MLCCPMSDGLYSLSEVIISLSKKTQPAKQMAGLYNKHVDYRDPPSVQTVSEFIGDIKRGDIGSTSEAYARGHLGPVKVGSRSLYGFNEDFVTLNPYMGSDSINPFINTAKKEKKGAFILVKTSNPSSGEFQDRRIDGRPLFEYVAEKVNEWGSDYVGECGYSYVGAVVGATYPEQARITRKLMPKAYILVPGYGAQGATAKDLLPNFDENGLGAIVNSSRGIIAAYKQEKYAKFGAEHFADASRAAVIDMQKDIASVL